MGVDQLWGDARTRTAIKQPFIHLLGCWKTLDNVFAFIVAYISSDDGCPAAACADDDDPPRPPEFWFCS
jgi:hypothetical protein